MNHPRRGTGAQIYTLGAPAVLAAPALGLASAMSSGRMILTFVLLAGAPMGVMAGLLAGIHRRRALLDSAYRNTAIAWVAVTLLWLTPLDAWVVTGERSFALLQWLRVGAGVLVAACFARLAARAWGPPLKTRIGLVVAFGAVFLFFGNLAVSVVGRSIAGEAGVEAVSGALAAFAIDAVVTCLLLLPGLFGSPLEE